MSAESLILSLQNTQQTTALLTASSIVTAIALYSLISAASVSVPFIADQIVFNAALRGKRFRLLFLGLLAASNASRMLFCFAQLFVTDSTVQWNETLFLIPPLLFFSTFTVILSLWSELIFQDDLRRFPASQLAVFLNGTLYLGFLVITLINHFQGQSFLRESLNLIAGYDALAACICIVCGCVICKKICAAVEEIPNFQWKQSGKLLWRLVAFCIISAGVFVLRSLCCILMGNIRTERFVFNSIKPIVWQLLTLILTEWIPTVALTILISPSSVSRHHCCKDDDRAYPFLGHSNDETHHTTWMESHYVPGEAG